jgi:plastocyanin
VSTSFFDGLATAVPVCDAFPYLFLDVKDPYIVHIFLNHFTKNPIFQKEVKVEGYETEGRVRRTVLALTLGLYWLVVARSEAASLSGTVSFDEKPVEDAVVYLESVRPRPPSPKREPVVIEQRNLAFSQRIIPIEQGTPVTFTNRDSVPHGIYSPSVEAAKFNLGTYSHGEERRLVFQSPGEIILLCHIHPEMEARLFVFRDPYFTTTTADGRYRVRDVPPGTYFLRVWRPRQQTPTDPLELSLAGDLTLDLRLNR